MENGAQLQDISHRIALIGHVRHNCSFRFISMNTDNNDANQTEAVVVRALKVGEVYEHSIRIVAALAGIYQLQATLRGATFERHLIPEASSKDVASSDIIYNISSLQLIAR